MVCGPKESGSGILVQFREGDPKAIAEHIASGLPLLGWEISERYTDLANGRIKAFKGGPFVDVDVNVPKGGPYAGRIIGTIRLAGE